MSSKRLDLDYDYYEMRPTMEAMLAMREQCEAEDAKWMVGGNEPVLAYVTRDGERVAQGGAA